MCVEDGGRVAIDGVAALGTLESYSRGSASAGCSPPIPSARCRSADGASGWGCHRPGGRSGIDPDESRHGAVGMALPRMVVHVGCDYRSRLYLPSGACTCSVLRRSARRGGRLRRSRQRCSRSRRFRIESSPVAGASPSRAGTGSSPEARAGSRKCRRCPTGRRCRGSGGDAPGSSDGPRAREVLRATAHTYQTDYCSRLPVIAHTGRR